MGVKARTGEGAMGCMDGKLAVVVAVPWGMPARAGALPVRESGSAGLPDHWGPRGTRAVLAGGLDSPWPDWALVAAVVALPTALPMEENFCLMESRWASILDRMLSVTPPSEVNPPVNSPSLLVIDPMAEAIARGA
jgi:hypothetical protein